MNRIGDVIVKVDVHSDDLDKMKRLSKRLVKQLNQAQDTLNKINDLELDFEIKSHIETHPNVKSVKEISPRPMTADEVRNFFKENLSKSDVTNITSIARDEHKSISERIDALDRLSNSQYFHDNK